jgi:hypothetical protein
MKGRSEASLHASMATGAASPSLVIVQLAVQCDVHHDLYALDALLRLLLLTYGYLFWGC